MVPKNTHIKKSHFKSDKTKSGLILMTKRFGCRFIKIYHLCPSKFLKYFYKTNMIPKNMESNKEPKLVTCQLVSSKFQDKKVSADLQFDTI